MASDLAAFRSEFPEWIAVLDAQITYWLDKNTAYLCADSFGDCIDDAILYRSAHMLALSQARIANTQSSGGVVVSGATGAVTSASVDGVSVSYALSANATGDSNSEAWYQQTPYGQYYLSLRESCLAPITMTNA